MATLFAPKILGLLNNYSQYLCIKRISQSKKIKVLVSPRLIYTSSKNLTFFESDPKGEYKKFSPKLHPKDHIRNGLRIVKNEIEVWKDEVKEAWVGDMFLRGLPGVVDKEFEFKSEKDLSKWIVTSDKDNLEGESTCQLIINENGKGVFSGNLCLDTPKDGKLKKTGYCNMRTIRCTASFQRDSHYEWGMYTHIVMRVRGDGRTYGLNLATSGYFDITWNDVFSYALFTRGGPYWQYSKIPFSKFFFTSKGKVQDRQGPVPQTQIGSFGITMAERVPGPFCLEIDYIGLEYDPTHTEEFAYEMYSVPAGIAQN